MAQLKLGIWGKSRVWFWSHFPGCPISERVLLNKVTATGINVSTLNSHLSPGSVRFSGHVDIYHFPVEPSLYSIHFPWTLLPIPLPLTKLLQDSAQKPCLCEVSWNVLRHKGFFILSASTFPLHLLLSFICLYVCLLLMSIFSALQKQSQVQWMFAEWLTHY